jgi:hypothetical protein
MKLFLLLITSAGLVLSSCTHRTQHSKESSARVSESGRANSSEGLPTVSDCEDAAKSLMAKFQKLFLVAQVEPLEKGVCRIVVHHSATYSFLEFINAATASKINPLIYTHVVAGTTPKRKVAIEIYNVTEDGLIPPAASSPEAKATRLLQCEAAWSRVSARVKSPTVTQLVEDKASDCKLLVTFEKISDLRDFVTAQTEQEISNGLVSYDLTVTGHTAVRIEVRLK